MSAKRKILVVEDNIANRLALCRILSQEYDTVEAENGLDALAILDREGGSISLIFLDIKMPKMDGFTFLKKLQQDQSYTSIPIIVATQSDNEGDEVRALTLGATDFISKPYKAQVILHRAANIISLRETAALMSQVEFDPLTGLRSQMFFYRHVRQILRQTPDKTYDMVCSNVENFKFINEVFGLAVGDQVLALLAHEIRSCVPHALSFGRLRADIFAYLVESGRHPPEKVLANAVVRICGESGVNDLSVKMGIYTISDPVLPVEQMCDRALLACSSIKGRYGQLVACYSDKFRQIQLRDKGLADSMESALNARQFEVYYQPKFNLRNSRICGAEALVRWNHPTLGLLLPGEFMPLFERNGFVTQLDQFVWQEVAIALHDWAQRGMPIVPVSVNVSRADIYNVDLETTLRGIRSRYQVDPAMLHLEITETAYTENHQQLCDTVTRLRDAGFTIEMDDFGSGYSSLNMLNELPIDILKLDLKFLREGQERGKRRSILSFVVSLARWLNLQVIAEGVETADQVEKLRNVGCSYAQGYYFSPPLPKREFEQFLKNVDDSQEDNDLKDDDILEKTRLLEAAAFEDYLTGLLNRRGLNNALSKLDLSGGNIAIFIFDMDNLKHCNDAQGHSVGDQMLQRFSRVLQTHTRSGDILSRIGGDEFVAVMPQMRLMEDAQKKGLEICNAFREGSPASEGDYTSCSAGLAIIQPGETFEDAFARADQALYRAKSREKGNCFT